jgi:hypothetical protein
VASSEPWETNLEHTSSHAAHPSQWSGAAAAAASGQPGRQIGKLLQQKLLKNWLIFMKIGEVGADWFY